ncbi:hypothetical protein ACO0LC_10100 [Undibacterium sp. JH2W]|uniref:hypothetical protein n=1 Tax=Undibacterium sp. JH2W TaxID=3413037 RepID=UPI003BF33527
MTDESNVDENLAGKIIFFSEKEYKGAAFIVMKTANPVNGTNGEVYNLSGIGLTGSDRERLKMKAGVDRVSHDYNKVFQSAYVDKGKWVGSWGDDTINFDSEKKQEHPTLHNWNKWLTGVKPG